MDVSNVDYAHVHDIVFENIHAEYDAVIQKPTIQENDLHVFFEDPNSAYMPYLFLVSVDFSQYSHGGTVRGRIDNVLFKDITVTSDRMPPSLFFGFDEEHCVKNIRIENLHRNGNKVDMQNAAFNIGKHVYNLEIAEIRNRN